MPIEPSVFQPIRKNDVHQRPFKAYKNYDIFREGWVGTSSGYVRHNALYLSYPEPLGETTLKFARNSEDQTAKSVVWKTIDHKYYRHPYDPARTQEHSNADTVEKKLWYSASILTMPYFQVGEKIKPGSLTGSFSLGDISYTLEDDALGNLRDPLVITSSFASSSDSIFHMSFNEVYRQFRDVAYLGTYKYALDYKVGQATRQAGSEYTQASLHGIITTGSFDRRAGLSSYFSSSKSYIRVAHSKEFNRFNRCDDWTICFWIKKNITGSSARHIITKYGTTVETFLDETTTWERSKTTPKHIAVHDHGHPHHPGKGRPAKKPRTPEVHLTKKSTKTLKTRDKNFHVPDVTQTWKKAKTPFMIGVESDKNSNETTYHFRSSDGSNELHITASKNTVSGSMLSNSWDHVLVRNSGSVCKMWINGYQKGQTGSLPTGTTANDMDIMIGSPNTLRMFLPKVIKRLTSTTNPSSFYNSDPDDGDITVTGLWTVQAGVTINIYGDLTINAGATFRIDSGATVYVWGTVFDPGTILDEGTLIIGERRSPHEYYLSEIRMYAYGLNQTAITSLAGRDYVSGSLFQTNVAGNVFYRNGQMVVSSPMPKYNTGSGTFGDTGSSENWDVKYKGQHTIYENQAFVRVPADLCNVPMNPTATYTPPTSGDVCTANDSNTLPGEFRKRMFVSGTALPYVTTIGLYDDDARLLAIGKCAQPIQKRSDVDMNFVVRWDY